MKIRRSLGQLQMRSIVQVYGTTTSFYSFVTKKHQEHNHQIEEDVIERDCPSTSEPGASRPLALPPAKQSRQPGPSVSNKADEVLGIIEDKLLGACEDDEYLFGKLIANQLRKVDEQRKFAQKLNVYMVQNLDIFSMIVWVMNVCTVYKVSKNNQPHLLFRDSFSIVFSDNASYFYRIVVLSY